MSINYAGLTEDYINKYQSRYANMTWSAGPNAGANTPVTTTSGQYASGIQDAGFGTNTCTDGKDDGKIGFGSAVLNAGEGILKGAWNGLTGLLGFGKDANGKTTWNPLKLLGSVAVAAACIAFPAVGVAACAIGAVAGGAQVVKGAVAASKATTDAEAKAAWENMGEGGATVVGCVLGAKASVGAMKGSSTAAVDDALKSLENGDDVVKALKGVDKSNIDDVTAALNKAGIKNVDEVSGAISKFGADTSALGNLDDSLTGMEKVTKTVKAFGKDALSSTKNNGSALLSKTSTALHQRKADVEDYSSKKTAQKNAKSEYDAAKKTYDESLKKNGWSEETYQAADDLKIAQDKLAAADDALDGTKIQQAKQAKADVKQDIKNAKAEIKKLDKTKVKDADVDALLKQREAAVAELNAAKAKTPFGKLTSSVKGTNTYKYLTQNETTSVIKNIKNINPLEVASKLGADGMNIYNFLKDGNNLSAAIKEFGYTDSMQVVQVLYSMGQVEQMV